MLYLRDRPDDAANFSATHQLRRGQVRAASTWSIWPCFTPELASYDALLTEVSSMSASSLPLLLRAMRLPTIAREHDDAIRRAEAENWGYARFLS